MMSNHLSTCLQSAVARSAGLPLKKSFSSNSKTFYQRPLPANCTAFASTQGKAYFASAMAHGGLKAFFSLVEQHSTQSEPAFCGLSTLVIVLNALAVDPRQVWKGPWRWYTEAMLNCCMDLEQVKQTGITLPQFHCLAHCQGLDAKLHYHQENGLEDFREAVRFACVERHPVYSQNARQRSSSETNHNEDLDTNTVTTPTPSKEEEKEESPLTVLVASYSRKVLGQTGDGHFSPIAAYDQSSDQVLILDTARFKYGAHWVPLPLLYQAMQPADSATGRSRGYVLLTAPTLETKATTTVPSPTEQQISETVECPICKTSYLRQAILLRCPMSQRDARQQFKAFLQQLNGKEPTLEQIIQVLTKNGQDLDFVWQITQVQLKPRAEDYESNDEVELVLSLIDEMREILDSLIQQQLMPGNDDPVLNLLRPLPEEVNGKTVSCRTQCRSNYSRSISINALQVIFLIYLAALPESRRREIVFFGGDRHNPNGGGQVLSDDGDGCIQEDVTLDRLARRQVLVEAQFLWAAIDVCDSNIL